MMSTTTTSFRKTTLSHAQKTVLAMSRAQYLETIHATRPADKLYVGVCIFRMDAHSSRPSVLLLRRSAAASSTTTASSGANDASANTVSMASINTNTTATTTSSSSWWRNGHRDKQRQRRSNNSDGGTGGREGVRNGDRNGDRLESGIWELPGGKVREGDFCISAAVARRVAEQTGLRVVRVLGALQDVRRISEVRILDWDEDGVGIFLTGEDGIDEQGNRSGTNLSVLDGATLTNSSGGGTTRSRSGCSSAMSRRSPIHNPHLVLRRECLQLNYAVLVQSHEDLAVRSREHDELVWASFSRAEALRMPEELRTVVHQGLAFAGEYLF